MKQALIVDPQGAAEDFVRGALELFQPTRAATLQEAEALLSGADFDAVLIAKQDEICDGALWTMLERITRLAAEDAIVLLYTEEGDAALHARAGGMGVIVVTAPAEVRVRALIDEVTAG